LRDYEIVVGLFRRVKHFLLLLNQTMYKTIALIVFLFGALMLHAENKNLPYQIAGQAVEAANGKSVPYATVTLQNDSAKTVKKVSSDINGKFSFFVKEKRKYTVIISFMGFREAKVTANVTGAKTDVGQISLEEGVVMKEVSIVAQKPLVKVDPDKLTYSVEADPESKTSNVLEMMRKIPLITVDSEDNVSLNGQSNFKVLINGKSSSMMSNNLKEILKSLPANSVKDIEVITNPSSKYDAEGVGGIINIITTQKKMAGYNGSINTGFDSRGGYNAGLYLATKINKFSFSGRYSYNYFRDPESKYTSDRTNLVSDTYHTTNASGSSKSHGSSNNFSGEASYEIDSLDLISTSFWGYGYAYRSNSFSSNDVLNANNIRSQYFDNISTGRSTYNTLSGNIDYQRSFKKPDKTFTVSYKLDNNPNTSNYQSDIANTFNYTPYSQRSVTDALTREQTLQVDYYDPLSAKHQIECGIKAIYRQNDSNSDAYLLNLQTGNWDYSQAKSNELDYNQYILGAYGGYVLKLKNLTAKGGLRTEFTWNDATSTSATVVKFDNHLQNVVPYITLNYQLKPGKNIKASYTQRLYRPGIWYLNPYVDTTDPQNISFGNPHLKSEIAHSFELVYSVFTPKFNFSLTGRGAFTNNSIESLSTISPDGIKSTTYKNIGTDMNMGLNVYVSYRPSEKFNIYYNGGGRYVKMEANNGYSITNKGYSYSNYVGARFMLWKNNSISFNGGVYSPSIMLQGKSSTYSYSGISMSQSFFDKKMSVNLSVSNPFKKSIVYSTNSNDPYYTQHSETIYPSRSFRCSVTYNFGKSGMDVKKARRSIQNDDVKSGGSSSSGSGSEGN